MSELTTSKLNVISQNRANLITNFYELLYQYAVYPDILNNKEMIKAIFMMCSQGIIEIYSKNYPLEKQELTRPLQIYQEFLKKAKIEHIINKEFCRFPLRIFTFVR